MVLQVLVSKWKIRWYWQTRERDQKGKYRTIKVSNPKCSLLLIYLPVNFMIV